MANKNQTEFLDAQVLNDMKININKMPERMERGLSLIYPEKSESYLEFLLDRSKRGKCEHIDVALDVMQALDCGQTIQEAATLIDEPTSLFGAKVRSVILSWAKQGPEFFKETLPCPYEALDQSTQESIALIEKENKTYAEKAKVKEKI